MTYDVNNSLPENMQSGPARPSVGIGSVIGNSPEDVVSLHGATPVAQRSGAAQAAVATTTATNSTPYGYTTAAQANAIVTLLNEIRATLVQKGIMKGSA